MNIHEALAAIESGKAIKVEFLSDHTGADVYYIIQATEFPTGITTIKYGTGMVCDKKYQKTLAGMNFKSLDGICIPWLKIIKDTKLTPMEITDILIDLNRLKDECAKRIQSDRKHDALAN